MIAKGQKVNQTLSDGETIKFSRKTARKPSERLRFIRDVVDKQCFGNDPILRALEFTVANQPVSLDARVLPVPRLVMGREEFMPERGVWNRLHDTFFYPAELRVWAVVNYDGLHVREDLLWRFLSQLQIRAQERGMRIKPPVLVQDLRYPDPEKDI